MGRANAADQPDRKTEGDDPEKPLRKDMVEAGRIWRNIRSGDFYPELDGKVFRSPSEMTKNQQARFTRLLEVLNSWAEPSTEEMVTSPSPLQEDAVGVADLDAQAVPNENRISYNPIKVFTEIVGAEANKPQTTNKSIVAQVDEILQEKLEDTPLSSRGILMKDSLDGGVLVQVGLQQYSSINDVPDPEIRQLLKESVEEWERRLDN
ncbi:MAG: hypothetical protein P8Z00_04510 [Anaerolineales bacterium]